MERTITTRRRARWPHAVWTTLVVGLYAVLVLMAWSTEQSAGQCSGIGWGCSLSGSDAAGFVALLLAAPITLALVAGHAAIAAFRWWRHRVVHSPG